MTPQPTNVHICSTDRYNKLDVSEMWEAAHQQCVEEAEHRYHHGGPLLDNRPGMLACPAIGAARVALDRLVQRDREVLRRVDHWKGILPSSSELA
jgi:hypothetical protein